MKRREHWKGTFETPLLSSLFEAYSNFWGERLSAQDA